jgi:nitroimidazol reductase NimA-like FMN-containing flavoprotein (pyridoxamine 5'-phosphate oxidase superfamily)
MIYKSVIGYGNAYILSDIDSKLKALDAIMDNYSNQSFEYSNAAIEKTTVIKVEIEHMTGKRSV